MFIKDKKFTTYDVYQSAFLCMNGLDVRMYKDEKGKVVFAFNDDDNGKLIELLDEFNSGKQVDVLRFISVVKNLRNQMYSILKEKQ